MSGELSTMTMPMFTMMWKDGRPQLVPHLLHNGLMLTPRIQTYLDRHGAKESKEIVGLPIAEVTHDGRQVYALPGGQSFVEPASGEGR